MAGAITGLKLTAIFYCFGLAFSALIGGYRKEKFLRLCSLALGGTIGFLLTYAYWGWHLFAAHRNPFFPYYNNFFLSPDALPNTFADERFRPDTLLDALLSPLHLLLRSNRFSELTLSDPRLLIGLLALLGLYALHHKQLPALRNRIGILLVFFISSFLLWVVQYGIYRYVIVLELLGSLALVVIVQWLPRWRNIALLVAAVLVSADTKRPNWGRVKSTAPMAGIRAPAIPGDSLVLIASGEPLAYLALGLPASVPLVAVSNNLMSPERCTQLQIRAQQMVSRHRGPVWLLSSDETGSEPGQSLILRYYGLQVAGACVAYTNSLAGAQLCPQRRIPTPSIACPTP